MRVVKFSLVGEIGIQFRLAVLAGLSSLGTRLCRIHVSNATISLAGQCRTHADARGQTEDEPDFGNTLAVLSSFQLSAKRHLGFHAAESRKQAIAATRPYRSDRSRIRIRVRWAKGT